MKDEVPNLKDFGDRLRDAIHRRPRLVSTLVVVLLIGGFAVLLI